MPRSDCRGPFWRVSGGRSGRFCAEFGIQGMGWGWGRGFKHRRWCYGFPMWKYGWKNLFSPEAEKTFLENRLKFLDEEIKAIRERLGELNKLGDCADINS